MTQSMELLKSIPHWVGHKDKVPMNARTGKAAKSNNPQTWTTAGNAWNAKKRYGWDGIGYVFTVKAGIVGVDLDDCFEGNGRLLDDLKPWARDVVLCLESYTEYSPSGNGLHIYAKGAIPGSINKSADGFEMYNELRYFTVTGKQMPGTIDIIGERNDTLNALYAVYGDDHIKPLPDVRGTPNRAVTEKEISDLLNTLPVWGDYYDWLKVLMAVHDAFPNQTGVDLIEKWSPGKQGEVARKFRSFDKTAKSGVTIATLFHMAKQNGWEPPQRNPGRYSGGKYGATKADITNELASGGNHGRFAVAD